VPLVWIQLYFFEFSSRCFTETKMLSRKESWSTCKEGCAESAEVVGVESRGQGPFNETITIRLNSLLKLFLSILPFPFRTVVAF
jgi:hypothetical protein